MSKRNLEVYDDMLDYRDHMLRREFKPLNNDVYRYVSFYESS